MKDAETLWYPSRAFLFLWKLERRLFSNFAGSGYEFLRYRNGILMTFWTRAQAQARADELNAVDSVLEDMVAPAQEDEAIDQATGLHKMVLRMPVELFEDIRKAAEARGVVWQAEARRRLYVPSDDSFYDRLFGAKIRLFLDPDNDSSDTSNEVELEIGAVLGFIEDENILLHAKGGEILTRAGEVQS